MTPKTSRSSVRAAGIVVAVARRGKAELLLLRNRLRGEWGFPKGHLEPGEDLAAAAARELAEETGIRRFELVAGFSFTSRYRLPSGKHRGLQKEVTYFLATVDGRRARLSDEHDDLRWAAAAEAEELLPFGDLRTLARDAFRALASEEK